MYLKYIEGELNFKFSLFFSFINKQLFTNLKYSAIMQMENYCSIIMTGGIKVG